MLVCQNSSRPDNEFCNKGKIEREKGSGVSYSLNGLAGLATADGSCDSYTLQLRLVVDSNVVATV